MSKNVAEQKSQQQEEITEYGSGSDVVPQTENMQEKCKKNYKNSYRFYRNYFLKCLSTIEDLQPNGFACIQASRYFTVGVLPKYCSIPDPLTRKQRDRVERLLAQ